MGNILIFGEESYVGIVTVTLTRLKKNFSNITQAVMDTTEFQNLVYMTLISCSFQPIKLPQERQPPLLNPTPFPSYEDLVSLFISQIFI